MNLEDDVEAGDSLRAILAALGELVAHRVDRPMERPPMPAAGTVERARAALPELRAELACAQSWLAELHAEPRGSRPPGARALLLSRLTIDTAELVADIDFAEHVVECPPTWELFAEDRSEHSNAATALARRGAMSALRRGA